MEKKVEQRKCLKFCFINGISCRDALKLLQKTYGASALSRTQAFEWYKSFKEGRTSVENLPHTSRPATSINDENVKKVKTIVLENRSVTVRDIAGKLDISAGSVHTILHDVLGMRRLANPVPVAAGSTAGAAGEYVNNRKRRKCTEDPHSTEEGKGTAQLNRSRQLNANTAADAAPAEDEEDETSDKQLACVSNRGRVRKLTAKATLPFLY